MENTFNIIFSSMSIVALLLSIASIILIVTVVRNRKNKYSYSIETFSKEFGLIKEDVILETFLKFFLNKVPIEFWSMPASTSGKHHPSYALGKGGLIRHTKAAIKIADSLLNLEMYNHLDKNLIIAALMVHDSVKPGFTSDGKAISTQSKHPLFAVELLEKTLNEFKNKSNLNKEEYSKLSLQVEQIKRMVKSHMGQWNTDKEGNVILPKPEKEDEKFVHLCDYLASRKFLNINEEDLE